MKFTPISHNISAANCPHCGAYAKIEWFTCVFRDKIRPADITNINTLEFGVCSHCTAYSIWKCYNSSNRLFKIIFPSAGSVPNPNSDLPEDIVQDYNEAREIVNLSPRGAVALLRLAVQKLCKHLGEKGENINGDIKALVSKGLSPMIQKALDGVRVTGNSAVHPGTIDLRDDRDTAVKVFGLLNVIADVMITQPKMIDLYYDETLTAGDKAAIERRDNNSYERYY